MSARCIYPQYGGAVKTVRHADTLAPFSRATSPSLILCLYILKTIKINAGVEGRCGMKIIAIFDE